MYVAQYLGHTVVHLAGYTVSLLEYRQIFDLFGQPGILNGDRSVGDKEPAHLHILNAVSLVALVAAETEAAQQFLVVDLGNT